MAHQVHVIKGKDFVRVDGHGKLDIETSRRVLTDLAKACIEQKISHSLLDVRDAYGTMSITELYMLAAAFAEIGFKLNHKLAILHRLTGSDKSDFFAMCASRQGWNVRSFDSFEEAFEWLSDVNGA